MKPKLNGHLIAAAHQGVVQAQSILPGQHPEMVGGSKKKKKKQDQASKLLKPVCKWGDGDKLYAKWVAMPDYTKIRF